MKLHYGPRHAKAQKQKHVLESQVLAHLKRFGPSLYDALSARFDPNQSAEVQPVLRSLKEYGYIDVYSEKTVTITSSGLQQLES